MAKVFEGIDERLTAWIAAQRLFFVASAPSAGGHVNLAAAASWLPATRASRDASPRPVSSAEAKNARSTDGLPAFDG